MLDPEGHKLKTARNRLWSATYLIKKGIAFTPHNNGAHLVIWHFSRQINFWPGTGLFMADGLKGRGVKNLVAIIQGRKKWKEYDVD